MRLARLIDLLGRLADVFECIRVRNLGCCCDGEDFLDLGELGTASVLRAVVFATVSTSDCFLLEFLSAVVVRVVSSASWTRRCRSAVDLEVPETNAVVTLLRLFDVASGPILSISKLDDIWWVLDVTQDDRSSRL